MSVKKRLQALLAKANDKGCTKAEAEEAIALAQRIAEKHNLKLEDVADESNVEATIEELTDLLTIVVRRATLYGGMSFTAHPANHLFRRLISALSLRVVFDHPDTIPDGIKDSFVTIIGPERLIDLCMNVYAIIRSAMDTEWPAAQLKEKNKARRDFSKRISKKDFQEGMRHQFDRDLIQARVLIHTNMTPAQLTVHKKVQEVLDSIILKMFPAAQPAAFGVRSDYEMNDTVKAGMKAAAKYQISETLAAAALNRKRLS